jgi:hypothetical protein
MQALHTKNIWEKAIAKWDQERDQRRLRPPRPESPLGSWRRTPQTNEIKYHWLRWENDQMHETYRVDRNRTVY